MSLVIVGWVWYVLPFHLSSSKFLFYFRLRHPLLLIHFSFLLWFLRSFPRFFTSDANLSPRRSPSISVFFGACRSGMGLRGIAFRLWRFGRVFGVPAGSAMSLAVSVCFPFSFIVFQISLPFAFLTSPFIHPIFISACVSDIISLLFSPSLKPYPRAALLPFWCSLVLVGLGRASVFSRFIFGD